MVVVDGGQEVRKKTGMSKRKEKKKKYEQEEQLVDIYIHKRVKRNER